MDLKGKITDIIEKVKNDKDFAANFTKDPVAAVESILGVNLPNDQINAIIEGVKTKLTVDKAGDVLGSLKKLF